MKAMSIIKYVFSIVGLGMLIGAYFLFTNTNDFIKDSQVANGTVIDIISSRSNDNEIMYKPIFSFETQGGDKIQFTSSTSSNPPKYAMGETATVLYQEFSPEKARVKAYFSLWGPTTILGGMGLIFFTIGGSIILKERQNEQKVQELKLRGTRIKAKFQLVAINYSLEVNGRSPYQIHAQWLNPTTSELHLFKSDNLWYDPTSFIKDEELTVLIDKKKPKRYHMDLSFLPKVSS